MKYVPWLGIIILFVCICFNSVWDLRGYNADHAIQIIMAKFFSGAPEDFFYWGQSRLGSLIPVLLVIPIKYLNLPPLLSGTVLCLSLYLILIVLCFSFVKRTGSRLAMLLGLFMFPTTSYFLLIYPGHPWLTTATLSMAAFALIWFDQDMAPARKVNLRYVMAGLLLGLSTWVSETSVAAFAAIVVLLLADERKGFSIKKFLQAGLPFLVIFGTVSLLRKLSEGKEGFDYNYISIANPEQLIWGLTNFLDYASHQFNGSRYQVGDASSWPVLIAIFFHCVGLFMIFSKGCYKLNPLCAYLILFDVLFFAGTIASGHIYLGERQMQRFWVLFLLNSLIIIPVMSIRYFSGMRKGLMVALAAVFLVVMGYRNISHLKQESFGLGYQTRVNGIRMKMKQLNNTRIQYLFGEYWDVHLYTVLSDFRLIGIPDNFSRVKKMMPDVLKSRHLYSLGKRPVPALGDISYIPTGISNIYKVQTQL